MEAPIGTVGLLAFLRGSCYAGILLGCLTQPSVAQESVSSPTTDAPIYRVGDTWTFSVDNTDASQKGTGTQVQTVVSVAENETRLSISTDGGAPIETALNDQGNTIRDDRSTYEPSKGWLSFPLTVGKSWDLRHVRLWRDSGYKAVMSEHVVVEAFERVQVSAGTFDAYRIALNGVTTSKLYGSQAVPSSATYWYAPSAKRIVKSTYTWHVVHHPAETSTSELTSFSLAH